MALGISELVDDLSNGMVALGPPSSTEELQLHFAREVHDEVAQPLINLILQIRALRAAHQGEEPFGGELAVVEDSVRQVLRRTRGMVVDLRERADIRLRFAEALVRELPTPAGRNLRVQASSRWPAEINGWAAFNLLRIVQQAVVNAWRHGQARAIEVMLDLGLADDAIVIVLDDGIGLQDSTRGFGMIGMEERAVILGGTFTAQTRGRGGTRVEVRIPVAYLA